MDEELDVEVVNWLLKVDGVDPGEAALLAGMISVTTAELVTGDKRALSALVEERAIGLIAALKGRCHCIESLVIRLLERFGFSAIRYHLQLCVDVDTTVRICLGQEGDASEVDFTCGLLSFLNGFPGRELLRADNPSMSELS